MSKLFKRILYKTYDLKHKYYIRRDIRKGYIAPDGQPLKCFKCGCKELEEYNEYYMDGGYREEYSVRCKECKQPLSHWAYGYWEL